MSHPEQSTMRNKKHVRTALVTGASAGMGKSFCEQLASRNYNVVMVARREAKMNTIAQELRAKYQVHIEVVAGDMSDPDTPAALLDFLEQHNIQIDYLVNNAGADMPHLLNDRDWQCHRNKFELMMIAAANMCHRFIPAMRNQGYGRVVNVASVMGRMPSNKGGCTYGPSKAYLISLSEDLALELAGSGVRVMALCPGFTHTDMHQVAGADALAMKASTPNFLWYDASTVVAEGLAAIERGRSVYVSGRLYRWLDPFMQSVLTRWIFKFRANT